MNKITFLEAFYEDLDQDDEDFLGIRFIREVKDDFYPQDSEMMNLLSLRNLMNLKLINMR